VSSTWEPPDTMTEPVTVPQNRRVRRRSTFRSPRWVRPFAARSALERSAGDGLCIQVEADGLINVPEKPPPETKLVELKDVPEEKVEAVLAALEVRVLLEGDGRAVADRVARCARARRRALRLSASWRRLSSASSWRSSAARSAGSFKTCQALRTTFIR
jgi:hypothetical protein